MSNRSLLVAAGALAVLLAMAAIFVLPGGDDDALPASPVSDVPAGPVDVTVADTGETFTTTFHRPATAPARVLVAAPSRNADEASLAPLVAEIERRACGAVITFDARLLERTRPRDAYQAILDQLASVFGFTGSEVSTLGASFTGLPSLQAAESVGAESAFVLSPSDEAPEPPPGDVRVLLLGASDDGGFVAIYEQWRDLGFDAVEFPSAAHGTAMFQDDVSADVVARIADSFCA